MARPAKFYHNKRMDVEIVDEAVARDVGLTGEFEIVKPNETDTAPKQPQKLFKLVPQEQIRDTDVAVMTRGMELMLNYLPPDCADLIHEYHVSTGVPLWQAVAGYVIRARETGSLFSPIILAEWSDGVVPHAPRPCEFCQLPVRPKTWGQKRCCNNCVAGSVKELGHGEDCTIDWSLVEEQG